MIAQAATFVRHPRVELRPRSGPIYLPRTSAPAAVALNAVMNQSGPFWIGAGAITVALIIFGTVNNKVTRSATAF